jgi:prepilin-type N-terminal cleavage/methylation domain-containing protein
MLGGKNKQPLGYTIIEVLIVLAVSSFMFVIASSFINGKQERSSFTSGVNQMSSNIQDVIEQVADGRYSDIPVSCTYSSGSVSLGGGPALGQGANSQCVFLGKVLRLPTSSGSVNTYTIFSLAGGRLSVANVSSSPNAGDPTIIDPTLTLQQGIPQSLSVVNNTVTAYDRTSGLAVNTTAFGFIQSQGVAGNNGSFQTGGQSINLVYSPGISSTSANSSINNNLQYAKSISICMTDGTQTAMLVVGNSNNQLGVSVNRNPGALCP